MFDGGKKGCRECLEKKNDSNRRRRASQQMSSLSPPIQQQVSENTARIQNLEDILLNQLAGPSYDNKDAFFDCPSVRSVQMPTSSGLETRRIAVLSIGIDAYEHVPPLRNCLSDCQKLKARFDEVDAHVTICENPIKKSIKRAVWEFKKSLGKALLGSKLAFALLHYAGHGVEVDGEIYILPQNADLHDLEDGMEHDEKIDFLRDECYAVSDLLKTLSGEQLDGMSVAVVLDMCRDTPVGLQGFPGAGETLNLGVKDQGRLLLTSTASGKRAPDDGCFLDILLGHLFTPDKDISEAFAATATETHANFAGTSGVSRFVIKATAVERGTCSCANSSNKHVRVCPSCVGVGGPDSEAHAVSSSLDILS